LDTTGRLIQSPDFSRIENAFLKIMTSSDPGKSKVDQLNDCMMSLKNSISCGTLENRREKNCFLIYRASDYLRPYEEELELKNKEFLQSMHRLRTRISFDLIEHSFLFVQNASPLFNVYVDRFKMLQKTTTQVFFYLEAHSTYQFIRNLHEFIDMKMKNLIDDYSPDMITPEEFVSFANNEGKTRKASDEKEIEDMENQIHEMEDEAKNATAQFAIGLTKEAVTMLSSVLVPEEVSLVEGAVFAGIEAVKKITDMVTGKEEEIEEKGLGDVFQHLVRRQELLRKAHYSSMILEKMKGKASELVYFMRMVRLFNLLTTKKLDKRNDFIGVLITERINPNSEFVEYFVRTLDKISQTPAKSPLAC